MKALILFLLLTSLAAAGVKEDLQKPTKLDSALWLINKKQVFYTENRIDSRAASTLSLILPGSGNVYAKQFVPAVLFLGIETFAWVKILNNQDKDYSYCCYGGDTEKKSFPFRYISILFFNRIGSALIAGEGAKNHNKKLKRMLHIFK